MKNSRSYEQRSMRNTFGTEQILQNKNSSMIRSFLAFCALLAFLVVLTVPVSAIGYHNLEMYGTVIDVNMTTLTIEAACEKQDCSQMFKGLFQGGAPEGTDFSAIHQGDLIKVTFVEQHRARESNDPKLNFAIPSDEMRYVWWNGVGILTMAVNETEPRIRKSSGIITYSLAGNYSVEYTLFNPAVGDKIPDHSTWWPATGAAIKLKQKGVLLENRTLLTGEVFEFKNHADNSTIRIRFKGGKLNDVMKSMYNGVNFNIEVITEGIMPDVKGPALQESLPTQAQKSPSFSILSVLAICGVYILNRRRMSKN